MKHSFRVILLIVGVALLGLTARYAQAAASQTAQPPAAKLTASQKPAPPPAGDSSDAPSPELVAQGRTRYEAYKCKDCHGDKGEGTEDGPDLVGTRKNAEQIEAFLKKPSKDADIKGMPAIPADSPDLKPLVAYVLSLKGSKAK
jgi:mono/diheme cytochrome c family protein